MMQWIHDRLKGVAFWFFILPLSVTFVFFGVEGAISFTSTQGAGLKVNGETVDPARIRESYQNQISELARAFEGEIPEAARKEVQDSIINGFVQQQLLAQRAKDAGYQVTDEEVAASIRSLPYFQVGGEFSRDAYTALLQQNNLSMASFEAEQRQQLLTTQLVGGIARSSFLTSREINEVLALQGEQRDLAYATLPVAPVIAAAKPTEAQLDAWLKGHAADFRTEESVSLQFVELRRADIAAKVVVTEASLRAYFDTIKERYATAEKRRARHILIESADGVDAKTDGAAKAKADGLLAQLKGGADFAALAKANSADPGSAAAGGDLGLQEKDFFVGPFAAAVWGMTPGGLQVVKTQFGYHVVRLEEVSAGVGKSFEDVRADITPEFQTAEADKTFGALQDKLEETAFESSGSLDPVARAVGAPLQTVANYTRSAGGALLPADKKLIDAVFAKSVLDGANSRAVDLGDGRLVVARVTEHLKPRDQPLLAVRDRVEAAVKTAQAKETLAASAQAALKAVEGGAALATVTGATVTTPGWVDRKATGVAPELLKAVFVGPRPAAPRSGVVALANGDQVVWQVSAGRAGAPLEGEAAAAAARQLVQQAQQRDFTGYLAAIRAKAKVSVDPALFN
jgi:peptidyl-prolyl cis-trans isomerase D